MLGLNKASFKRTQHCWNINCWSNNVSPCVGQCWIRNEYSKTVTQTISKPGNITQHEVRAGAAILHATKLKDVDVTIWFCFDGGKIIIVELSTVSKSVMFNKQNLKYSWDELHWYLLNKIECKMQGACGEIFGIFHRFSSHVWCKPSLSKTLF
jgi:hypothetical protein